MKQFLLIALFLLIVDSAPAQSGRAVAPSDAVAASQTRPVKDMFTEVNGYVRARGAEFDTKKVPFSDDLLKRVQLEQRQLAAKYAASASARKDLTADDTYYLGLLNWIAENFDNTVDHLLRYLTLPDSAADKRQTARSLITVIDAKQAKLDAAEAMLAKYRKEPIRLTEISRMENEIAKAYQTKHDPVRMQPHAQAAYDAAKALIRDPATTQRGLDEVLDSGMLVFEADRDLPDQKRADTALDDMRLLALEVRSSAFYYYAVDHMMTYLIETGRKPEATKLYTTTMQDLDRDFIEKDKLADARDRFERRERQYVILGMPAPEMQAVDQTFPAKVDSLSSLKGKVVVLDFWATWCIPCFEAMPLLSEWQDQYGKDGLEIIGMTRYYGAEKGLPTERAAELNAIRAFQQKHMLKYDIAVLGDQVTQLSYGATLLPTMAVIDRHGVLRYVASGTSSTRLFEVHEMITKLLAEK